MASMGIVLKNHNIVQSIRSRLGLPPSWIRVQLLNRMVLVRHGTIREIPDYDDAWTTSLINQSSIFFDVGCNLGWFSLISCITNPERRVIAIDPNPNALMITAQNLFHNGYAQQVTFVLSFMEDSDGVDVLFHTVGTGAAGSRFTSHAKTAQRHNSKYFVRTQKLDTLSKTLNLCPDFVKIDVEGAETSVLNGAIEVARQQKTRFLVEMHSNPELPMQENGEQVLRWCETMQYDAFYLKTHEKVTDISCFAHRGRCHLLLQPMSMQYPDNFKHIQQGDNLEKAWHL